MVGYSKSGVEWNDNIYLKDNTIHKVFFSWTVVPKYDNYAQDLSLIKLLCEVWSYLYLALSLQIPRMKMSELSSRFRGTIPIKTILRQVGLINFFRN